MGVSSSRPASKSSKSSGPSVGTAVVAGAAAGIVAATVISNAPKKEDGTMSTGTSIGVIICVICVFVGFFALMAANSR